ncbi:MAG: hypothetical protein JJU13_21150 [Balneolaceae bacterium]|nr:hypothetical protein [Balneolaceae bacterium]
MLQKILHKLFWGVFRHLLTERLYIQVRYRLENGFFPDLENPERLSEKIQYLKLHERTDLRRRVADRFKVRSYVKKKAGANYLIPLLGCYDRLTLKEWDLLPKSFVLKATHGSAMVKLVHDKSDESFETVQALTEKWLSTDYSKIGKEWVYEGIQPQIIAEKLLSDTVEYKFFCFHGKVKVFYQFLYSPGKTVRNFFDENLKQLDLSFRIPEYQKKKPAEVNLPSHIGDAITVAEKLSADFNFIRVDLYLTSDRIYFGELTNFPGNGFNRFVPDEVDKRYGELLRL